MSDGDRDKVEELRRITRRPLGELDRAIRPTPPSETYWDELPGEHLRTFLHWMLGAMSTLDERLANLEDMMLAEREHRQASLPLPAYRTGQDRQEDEAGAAALRTELGLIRTLLDLDRPVTAVDRANIAFQLRRMVERFAWLNNELRRLQGIPPIEFDPRD